MTKTNSTIVQPTSDIVLKCKNGDTQAFKILVETMQPYAYNIAFKLLLNKDDAKDAVQDSFVKIWKHLKNYHPKHLFSTWIYKIVVNTCLDKLKSIEKHNKIAHNTPVNNELESSVVNRDLIKKIKHLSKGLPQKQRTIFILTDLNGLTIEEVSIILNTTKGKVKSDLYYARKNIRERLTKLDNI